MADDDRDKLFKVKDMMNDSRFKGKEKTKKLKTYLFQIGTYNPFNDKNEELSSVFLLKYYYDIKNAMETQQVIKQNE